MSVWFQSDINLQVEVHKLVAQQGIGLENKDKIEPNGESKGARSQGSGNPGPNSIPTPVANSGGTRGGPSLWGHGIEITHAGGNVTKNDVSNVTNNRDLGNTYTNSIVSVNNITITIPRHKRRRPRKRRLLCAPVGQVRTVLQEDSLQVKCGRCSIMLRSRRTNPHVFGI